MPFSEIGSLVLVGAGKMGGAMLHGWLKKGMNPKSVAIVDPHIGSEAFSMLIEYSITHYKDAGDISEPADVVMLAVKPQQMGEALPALKRAVGPSTLVVSIAAGITAAQIERWLGGNIAVVRTMPNTPALLGAGVTGLYAAPQVDAAGRQRAEQLLASAGATVWVAGESLVDAVTAVSGSGPAYAFLLAEAMEAAAVAEGLPAADARSLVVHTLLGAGRMLAESGQAPAELRRQVTSPGGTTQAAIETFQAGGLETLVARAVHAARQRAAELATGAGA